MRKHQLWEKPRKSVPGRGNSMCERFVLGMSLERLRNRNRPLCLGLSERGCSGDEQADVNLNGPCKHGTVFGLCSEWDGKTRGGSGNCHTLVSILKAPSGCGWEVICKEGENHHSYTGGQAPSHASEGREKQKDSRNEGPGKGRNRAWL